MSSDTLGINDAARMIEDARRFLNDKDGPAFVAGLRGAFHPLAVAAEAAAGKELGYGDVLNVYAENNVNRRDIVFSTLLGLADKMQAAPAAGVRFVTAQLFLTYAMSWRYGSDAAIKALALVIAVRGHTHTPPAASISLSHRAPML